jgi:hypothetical protein
MSTLAMINTPMALKFQWYLYHSVLCDLKKERVQLCQPGTSWVVDVKDSDCCSFLPEDIVQERPMGWRWVEAALRGLCHHSWL